MVAKTESKVNKKRPSLTQILNFLAAFLYTTLNSIYLDVSNCVSHSFIVYTSSLYGTYPTRRVNIVLQTADSQFPLHYSRGGAIFIKKYKTKTIASHVRGSQMDYFSHRDFSISIGIFLIIYESFLAN